MDCTTHREQRHDKPPLPSPQVWLHQHAPLRVIEHVIGASLLGGELAGVPAFAQEVQDFVPRYAADVEAAATCIWGGGRNAETQVAAFGPPRAPGDGMRKPRFPHLVDQARGGCFRARWLHTSTAVDNLTDDDLLEENIDLLVRPVLGLGDLLHVVLAGASTFQKLHIQQIHTTRHCRRCSLSQCAFWQCRLQYRAWRHPPQRQ